MASLLIVISLSVCVSGVVGQTWQDYRSAYYDIYNHYYNNGTSLRDIIPVNNQSSAMTVQLGLALNSLNGFDAVLGQIDISGSMKLSWTDEVVFTTYQLTEYVQDSSILIDYDKAWSPFMVLINAVDTVKHVGDTTYKLRYSPKVERVEWEPRVLLRGSCTPDVTFYPFDRQECGFTYTAWGYTSEEINLQAISSDWDLRYVTESELHLRIGFDSEVKLLMHSYLVPV